MFIYCLRLSNFQHPTFKFTVHPQNQRYIFFLLPVVLFIILDSFGVSCPVLEISAIEMSAF